jgi:hypothetical protein
MPGLTRRALDAQRCLHDGHSAEDCDNEHLFLHAGCHPGLPTWAMYDKEQGTVVVTCSLCDSLVVELAIAP